MSIVELIKEIAGLESKLTHLLSASKPFKTYFDPPGVS